MIFNLREIEQSRGVGTLCYFPEIGSTSDEAKRLVCSNATLGGPLLVLCERQTAGRGQPGNEWYADDESLTFTWCVPENSVTAGVHSLLSLVAGASVCEAIEAVGISESRLKWPNDILLKREKVCGILIEKIFAQETAFLIGIGVNVLQCSMDHANSKPTPFPATSLRQHTNSILSQHDLLLEIVERLDRYICGSDSIGIAELHSRFEFIHEQIRFVLPNGEILRGICRGVNDSGMVLIERNGVIESHASGHILPTQ